MKNQIQHAYAYVFIMSALFLLSCNADSFEYPELKYIDTNRTFTKGDEAEAPLNPSDTYFGKSLQAWTRDWWKYVLSFDCASNPLNFPVLSSVPDQRGPVFFLVGSKDGIASRYIDIPRNKKILFPVINTIFSFPCADESFAPTANQTLEQFLGNHADKWLDQVTNLEVVLDGDLLSTRNANRISTGLFYLSGNKDLVNCLDVCVSGQSQPAVAEGYWHMLSNLKPGRHELTVHAEILQTGVVVDEHYSINIY